MRAIAITGFLLAAHLVSAQTTFDFQRDIRPILSKRCFPCHGPDDKARMMNLRLDNFDGAAGKNGGYVGIVPKNSAQSRVMARITDDKRPMPPTGPRLSTQEVELIRAWINSGAEYTSHWAFSKPTKRPIPAVRNQAWVRNGIDAFVLGRLEREGLQPSAEADRNTLARRAALDLTGLPPAPKLLESFLQDRSEKAYETFVQALLDSPRFGERWARVWLDLARYADTQGYEKDNRRTIWPYRDWVIKAFNSNMRFDQFTTEQLAGDLLPNPTQDQLIATGFHRNTMTNTEGGTDDEEFRDAAIKDRVAVTGQVWMGLTIGCAQCHTHKYDPISHKEFYQFYAFLNQTEDEDKPDDRPVLKFENTSTLVLRELPSAKQRKTRIHDRGNFLTPSTEVDANTPEAFPALPAGTPHNRLGLAKWLVSPDNPLTARVQVNRFWARLFGRGIVETEEDFGTQGASPSHPELLDWLAIEFMESGWNMKSLMKTIAMSATYRQSSAISPQLNEKDPYNKLFARGARFRLDAEVVRDQALAAAGLLSEKLYGPPVMPWQPEGIWQVVYNGERWETSRGEDRYRRGLYTFLRRTSPYPSMINYDAPTGEVCAVRRIRTNTPLQALTSLNDPAFVEAAQRLALHIMDEPTKNEKARAEALFRSVLLRSPSKEELQRIVTLHRQSRSELQPSTVSSQKLLNFDKILYTEDREVKLVYDGRAKDDASDWRYTTSDPGSGWDQATFNDSEWKVGKGLFGYFEKEEDRKNIATPWDTETIWLRREVNVPQGLGNIRLMIRTASSFEALINGVSAAASPLDRPGYYEYTLSPQATAALKPGKNILSLRVSRIHGMGKAQSIDVGLVASKDVDYGPRTRDLADRAAWVAVANALLNLDETVTRR